LKHRTIYLIVCLASGLIGLFVALSMPKEYGSSLKIADEHKQMDLIIGLDNLSVWVRDKTSGMVGDQGMEDPEIYSLLVKSRDFAQRMAEVELPEPYSQTYAQYLATHRRAPWWKRIFEPKDSAERLFEVISANIQSKLDTKHYTIQLQFTDQDPLVAALMVDSMRAVFALQLTQVRTRKAKIDYDNARDARRAAAYKYHQAQETYGCYADTHTDLALPGEQNKLQQLEHLRDEAFDVYRKAAIKATRMRALLQRQVPDFTLLTNPTVPLKPYKPNAWAYALAFMFIAWALTWWTLRIRERLKNSRTKELKNLKNQA